MVDTMKLTKHDIVDYLEEYEDHDFEDMELEYCYDRIESCFENYLEKEGSEMDLVMARYWLSQAWKVEDEIEK